MLVKMIIWFVSSSPTPDSPTPGFSTKKQVFNGFKKQSQFADNDDYIGYTTL